MDTKAAYAAGAGSAEALPSNATDPAAFARSAALSRTELAAAEQQAQAAEDFASPTPLEDLKPGEIAAKRDYQIGEVARKALAVRIPVYRFFNGSTGAHFFTTSTTERDNVVNTLSPPFSLEGEAFSVASAFSPGLSQVHRFYNTHSGVHFYTISESERANVVATLPHFSYEGVAYHASQVAGAGLIPFYRFYVPSKGFHFYTAKESEKDSIIANLAATYTYEGIGYYVLDSDWRVERLPHSGVTSSQCYQAGSNMLVDCASQGATGLNLQQDGHRVDINRMSYRELPNPAGGNYPRTSCVKDDVTGLVWEGKTDGGERSGSFTYTNFGDGTTGDASAYVNRVNQLALCGYTDWRLPTRQELLTIVDFGRITGPAIDINWFPETAEGDYWSGESVSANSSLVGSVGFSAGVSLFRFRSHETAVRLVRGRFTSGPRFSYSTVAYGSDGANNVVDDAWTGLQWRRCEQGRVWTGSVCAGTVSRYTHEQALAHARTQSGWRMPSVRELSSLVDLSVSGSAARVDPAAFPGASALHVWGASPDVRNDGQAWFVFFYDGFINHSFRQEDLPVRLVRVSFARVNL
ncbi:hypothetical protein LPB72_02685 [Hydrogenophaga crassostreae]|uniref:DUF1566 domain-containing protein n=1 Tax=Hydrogenophaga crassostreae TaxID=1763535 RepID=A0A162T6T6_9BURK|nr:hypothetical protein LPB072_02985 [Hydrogenophaga crassostreae]OAD43923.1 hypothetical protein LPB72_02685 [Hydrogenophaga crassostreae]